METTIKPILWSRGNKRNQYPIKIRITSNRKSKYIPLDIWVEKKYWNENTCRIRKSHSNHESLNQYIVSRLNDTFNNLGVIQRPSPNLVSDTFSLSSLLDLRIRESSSNGKVGHFKKLKTVKKHLILAGLGDLDVNDFGLEHIHRFTDYLTNTAQVQPQGRHSYLKYLRTSFRKAFELGKRTNREDPFSGFNIPTGKSKAPRSLTGYQIHQLEVLQLKQHQMPSLRFDALNTFLFSFFSYGMRFGDVIRIRWSDIIDGVIHYRMQKTNSSLKVKLSPKLVNLVKSYLPDDVYPKVFQNGIFRHLDSFDPLTLESHPIIEYECTYHKLGKTFFERMQNGNSVGVDEDGNPVYFTSEENKAYFNAQEKRDEFLIELVKAYSTKSNSRIFSLLENNYPSIESEYNKASSLNALINKELKHIAKELGITPFSCHSARHSFANSIRQTSTDILTISKMLGHKDLSITQTYLNRFEDIEAYSANSSLIEQLNNYFIIQKTL